MSIRIPASIDEATSALGALGALLTARQWERAAIVYAYTEPGNGQGARQPRPNSRAKYSIADFARLNIAGLRDEETVAWARAAWEDAVADGQATPAKPGDEVTLPDREFPKHPRTRSTFDGFRAQLRNRPDAITELVRDEPEIATMIAKQAVETPMVRTAIEARLAEPIQPRESYYEARPEPKRDHGDDLIRGINLLIPVVRAVQRGEWKPSPAEAMLLHALGLLLDQAASPEGAPQPELFTQIEQYLKEGVM